VGADTDWCPLRRIQDDAECQCFVDIPTAYEGRPAREVKFYHYQTITKLLGTRTKQRAELPTCVMSEIRSRHGENEVGYVQA